MYLDEGYSGASLSRPGLDALRDRAAWAEFDVVVLTAPDRLARNYVHQVLLIEELQGRGVRVEFVERPMSEDPHDQLLLQIRGAVAEYERTLITERMRRGRLAKVKAGQLLPWSKPPFGYLVDPLRPRDPTGVRLEPYEGATVAEMFGRYLEPGQSLYGIAKWLQEMGVAAPRGGSVWSSSAVRGMLRNPVYKGTACANRTRNVRARIWLSPLRPVGKGESYEWRPREEWIPISVPAIVSEEVYEAVQSKLDTNQKNAARNNQSHEYLLRALVSCGTCRLSVGARTGGSYSYYVCRGYTGVSTAKPRRSHSFPAQQLDALVWDDLYEALTSPEQIQAVLERARSGQWLSQELKSRRESTSKALSEVERQRQRLLDAYVAGVLELPEFERKRMELESRRQSLLAQAKQLEAAARHDIELGALACGIEAFCAQVREGLEYASFEHKRRLVELLIDRVVVTDDDVEIRYVVPTSPDGPHIPFCHLRTDHHCPTL